MGNMHGPAECPIDRNNFFVTYVVFSWYLGIIMSLRDRGVKPFGVRNGSESWLDEAVIGSTPLSLAIAFHRLHNPGWQMQSSRVGGNSR